MTQVDPRTAIWFWLRAGSPRHDWSAGQVYYCHRRVE
jgi:hypothetical protein